jgi:hypothetical protein
VGSLTFFNVDRLCASADLRTTPAVIDLSGVNFFEPFALIYLGMFLRHHNSRGITFDVIPPADPNARGYLTRQNFWQRFNFDPATLTPDLLHRMTTSTSLNDIVDIEPRPYIAEEVAQAVVEVLCPGSVPRIAVEVGIVGEMVSELVDNFAEHAQGPLAAFTMQLYPNGRRFDLAIGDCGVGIRGSLAGNPQYAHVASLPHHEVALLAFHPGVTAKQSGGGTGLWDVRDAVRRLSGVLRLATGDGYVQARGDQMKRGSMQFDLAGVQIEISIPIRG